MKSNIIAGFAGGVFVAVIIVVLLCCCKLHDYSPIYILNSSKSVMQTDSLLCSQTTGLDSTNIVSAKLKLLKEMEAKGILLTPQEYSSQISSYYNTIITFLIALFATFSFIGYFSIRIASKKDVLNTINELMDDSVQFRSRTTESITTIFADSFVSKEELDSLKEELTANISSIREGMPAESDETII